ncbi:acyl-CoA dehydrogenase family protein [Micromonospora sp. NPDC051543]|uniref:acyl-CoA dehydrogenase family protein n=1 Tax=Micromonospora sp. NPDC051543 TaxID=3364287 RepID=UPI0037AE21F7
MTVTQAPPQADLVRRASSLVPLLQSHSTWTEQNRRLHDEVIEAMTEAGIFRMRLPARYGGYESDTRTVVDVLTALSAGDGSASWIAGVNSITTWMASLLPDEVQDEIFSAPDVRLCGTLSPSGMCTPAEGGLTLNGRWGFISGALHAQWQMVIAMAPAPDGSLWPIMTAVPLNELQVVDDWHTSGLRGTGSVSTVAQNVFVPERRVLPLPLVLGEQYASRTNAASPIYRTPLLASASAMSVGVAVGLATAAREVFLERLPERKITYTAYEHQADAPLTHLQLAEATMLTDEAVFHAHRLADTVDSKGIDGTPWSLVERVRARADMGRATQLARRAVDLLASASGGSSVYQDVPIQRILRDVQAINLHALMNPDTNAELYGRILSGLEPNTLYI